MTKARATTIACRQVAMPVLRVAILNNVLKRSLGSKSLPGPCMMSLNFRGFVADTLFLNSLRTLVISEIEDDFLTDF